MANATATLAAGNGTDASSYAVATFGRIAGHCYLLGVVSAANTTGIIPTITGEGTWERLGAAGSGQFSSGGGQFFRIDVYRHQPAASDVTTNITILFSEVVLGAEWSIIDTFDVQNDSANNGDAVWPSANCVFANTANVLQPSVTLAPNATDGSAAIAFAGLAGTATFTWGAGDSELNESDGTAPARAVSAAYGAPNNTFTATASVNSKIGMWVLEGYAAAAGGTTGNMPLIVVEPLVPDVFLPLEAQQFVTPRIAVVPNVFTPTVGDEVIPPPVTPPIVTAPIGSDVLLGPDPLLGIRVDRFEWELLDRDLAPIGLITPSRDETATITADIDRPIQRSLGGLLLTTADAAAIDPLTDRLRPYLVLQNGERFPLGVYLFADHQRSVSTRLDTWQPQMYDQGLILGDKLDRTINVPAVFPIVPVMVGLLEEVGITNIVVKVADQQVGEPIGWSAGTERSRAIFDLAAQLGALQPYFDNEGTCIIESAPDPATAISDFRYGPGRIDADSIIETDDSYRAPNRYVVVGGATDTEVSGFYDVPAEAPHSFHRRGYRVTEVIDLPGIIDSNAATVAARAAYLTDTRTWSKVSFTSPLDPRLDLYALIEFEGADHPNEAIAHHQGLFMEVGFRMELFSGGNHDHDLARLWGPTI